MLAGRSNGRQIMLISRGRGMGYELEVQYRSGIENKVVDELFRFPPIILGPQFSKLSMLKKELQED